MERRNFLKGALALFGAAAVGASMMPGDAAAATPAPKLTPKEPELKPEPVETNDTGDLDADGQYYYRRRYRPRRRVVYYRRPRRVFYRPRRVYYARPRRVYYRPRRVYYRPRFFF